MFASSIDADRPLITNWLSHPRQKCRENVKLEIPLTGVGDGGEGEGRGYCGQRKVVLSGHPCFGA